MEKNNNKTKNEKKPTTVYFTTEILEAIEKIRDTSKIGESRNQIILTCIISGLKEKYNIEI